jgi:hypothetical protein
MVKFQRESATSATELPHEFVGANPVCDACATAADDARHRAWETQELLDREKSSQVFIRETGS